MELEPVHHRFGVKTPTNRATGSISVNSIVSARDNPSRLVTSLIPNYLWDVFAPLSVATNFFTVKNEVNSWYPFIETR